MVALTSKPMFKWVRSVMTLLLIGLLLPTGPALAAANAQSQMQVVEGSNLLQDPGFEASYSSSAYWTQFSTNSTRVICSRAGCGSRDTAKPRNGQNWLWFGGMDFSDPRDISPEVANVYQNVVFPFANCKTTLRFLLWIGEAEAGSDTNDAFRALVDGQAVFSTNATRRSTYSSYRLVSVDVSRFNNGGVHRVEFDTRISSQLVSFNVDDTSLVAESCVSAVKGDYSGDRKKDIAVFRDSTSSWFIYGIGSFLYGTNNDIPVPADYDGNGVIDIAVFRASNSTWYVRGIGEFVYGTVGDIPVVADYNGDRKADIAVFRPSNSTWYIRGLGESVYGTVGDIPVVGDYNGDGKDDIAVFRPSNSTWYLYGVAEFVYGTVGDIPVVADYNGDRKAEVAVYRPSNGFWYIRGIGDFHFGSPGDVPVVGDYNGDGKADLAVFSASTSTWYISNIGTFLFGTVGDIPV
jgi:hypothetical protein